jgi:hypothetical protein
MGADVFPSDLTDDPLLARSDKLIRFGGFIPAFGLCLIALTGWLFRPSTGTFIREELCLAAVGQVLVWLGMAGLRRSSSWTVPGVIFYVWMSGILGAVGVASTGVMPLVLVPLLAPVVASIARQRTKQSETR